MYTRSVSRSDKPLSGIYAPNGRMASNPANLLTGGLDKKDISFAKLAAALSSDVKELHQKPGEDDFWEARNKSQKSYVEFCEQKQADHAVEVTEMFAAMRGYVRGTDLLPGGLFHGSAATVLAAGAGI